MSLRLGRTSFVYFITQVLISVAGFLGTLFITNVMGPNIYGKYATGMAFLYWATIPTVATSTSINKRISEGIDPGEFLTAGIIINVTMSIVGGAVLVIATPYVNAHIGSTVSLLLAVLFGITILEQTLNQSLKGQKRVAAVGVASTLERIARTGAQIGLVFIIGYGLRGLFIGHVVSAILAILIAISLSTIRPCLPSKRHFLRIYEYAKYSWLSALQTRAFGWMDTIVLSFFVAKSLIGIYEAAWGLASLVGLVSVAIRETLFPEISEVSIEGDNKYIRDILSDGLAFAGVFAIPGLFGAALIGDRVLRIYGPEFNNGWTVLVLLIGSRVVSAYSSQLLSALNAFDRPDIAFRINFVFIVANVSLNVVLVWMFGWIGAAVATLLSVATTLFLAYITVGRLIDGLSVPKDEILRQIIAAGVMAILIGSLRRVVSPGLSETGLLVLLGAIVYVAVLVSISQFVRQKLIGLLPSALSQ